MSGLLCIALAYRLILPKNTIESLHVKATIEEALTALLTSSSDIATLYSVTENEKEYAFTLRDEIWQTELPDFLEKFYTDYYHMQGESRTILEELRASSPTTWYGIACKKAYEAFQRDSFRAVDTVGEWPRRFKFYREQIILVQTGKASLEVFRDLFAYFQKMMAGQYSEYKIAKAVNLYLT